MEIDEWIGRSLVFDKGSSRRYVCNRLMISEQLQTSRKMSKSVIDLIVDCSAQAGQWPRCKVHIAAASKMILEAMSACTADLS